ncbi:type II toxin-antitoxin system RelE/ParE family toxin [Pantoea brenneri]|uniref:type II toxin-antitoxin system RelE/ParE family toxin n=1 Tax=Pantoea brenneri TaxID=472694 RepID=UPI0028A041B2|nr:type II toxin-antitoxin system RelE/ParE family toxin [Pantoea brenneri]
MINVIKSWKHKALQRLYQKGDTRGLQEKDNRRIKLRLRVLDNAMTINPFSHFQGLNFHTLKGDKCHLYAINVRASWHITFELFDGDASILNPEDYH